MLDLQYIREHPREVVEALARRGDGDLVAKAVTNIQMLDLKRRRLLTEVETKRSERNRVSKEIGRMKDEAQRQERIAAMRAPGG